MGFGGIWPKTNLGRRFASVMLLLDWGTLAVPAGIVSAEFSAQRIVAPDATRSGHACLSEGQLAQAGVCRDCAAPLPPDRPG